MGSAATPDERTAAPLALSRSRELKERASRLIPGISQTFSKGPTQFPQGVSPVFLDRGSGCRVWDVDGNEYVDYVMALGSVILGHAYPRVDESVREQLSRGVSFSMPERAILPKPLQKPHPPLWVTVTSPGTELDAADRGIGCLGVAAASYAEQERRTKEYRRRIKRCDPVGAVNERVATLNFLYCHEDPKAAASTGLLMLGVFGLLNAHLLSTREAYPTRAYQSLGNLAPRPASDDGSPGDRRAVPEGIAIGDPDQIVAAVKRWESIGVDSINFIVNAAEILPQEQVLASLRLFAREVMPAFR